MRKFLIGVLCFISACVYAEVKLPVSCTASLPKGLLKGIIKESEINAFLKSGDWGQSSKSGKFWTAYSDRSHNITYQEPSESSDKYGELEFNESVRIAEINGNFALIYSEKQKGLDYPHISTSAVAKGWIPMKNLLLWGACPTNEKGIYNKALIVMNLDEMKAGKNEDLGKRYMNPETYDDVHSLVSSMEFLYVMKRADNGLVLLSTHHRLDGLVGQTLFGWVNPNSFVQCESNLFLEPNWKLMVAEQMAGQSVPVYKKSDESVRGCDIPMGCKNNVTEAKATMYRMNPQKMRYPLLSNDSQKDDLYKVIVFTSLDVTHFTLPVNDEKLPSRFGLENGGELENTLEVTNEKNVDSIRCILNVCHLTSEEIEKLKIISRTYMAFHGYTPKRSSYDLNYWQPVVLMPYEELAYLLDKFQNVVTAADCDDSNKRKLYAEAISACTRSMVSDISDFDMEKMSTEETISIIRELPEKTEAQEYYISGIEDVNRVSQADFDAMIAEFRNKFNRLKKIREQKYPFSFERNKITWYWVPVDDLP